MAEGYAKDYKEFGVVGPDDLSPALFKDGGEVLSQRLSDLFACIWEKESVPDNWGESVIVPIFKKRASLNKLSGRVLNRHYQHLVAHSPRFIHYARLGSLADAFNRPQDLTVTDSPKVTGVFLTKELISPNGFASLVQDATERSKSLLNEALSPNRTRKMVQVLDDMSDTLCRVADLADCIRMLHPDGPFRVAASEACQAIGRLVEELNTTPELYFASVRASQAGATVGRSPGCLPIDDTMDKIDRRVLDLFVADFELSGVQLQDPSRQAEFVKTASTALALGATFVETAHTPVLFPPPDLAFKNADKWSPPFEQIQLTHPVLEDPRPDVRAATYRTYYAPLPGQETRLTELMEMRHRMARAAGFDTYADRSVRNSLAETSENVRLFLDHLCHLLSPNASHVVRDHLVPATRQSNSKFPTDHLGHMPAHDRIWPWDVSYALGLCRQTARVDSAVAVLNQLNFLAFFFQQLVDYFSLGACMEGVSQLADCLFGLKLRVEPIIPGECWHPSVVKIGVYARRHSMPDMKPGPEKQIGLVYCDLLDRPGKPAQATYAQLDQRLHSGHPESTLLTTRSLGYGTPMPASSCLLSSIQRAAGVADWMMCDPDYLGAWPHRFSHLVGYGGRYYSYLMARAGAHLVWSQCFANDPWSSSKGQLYQERILRHGGEFHPATMLSDLLSYNNEESNISSILSPEQLARGLRDHVDESEAAASAMLSKMSSPGLHQPSGFR
ncbi:hypothetical protein T265_11166 [Opisthorchis viverrini]|uniref:Peptidase M3A/M3B catalytic domain-containing protein n=1 Tax=Opisthorchis viverrini TaxID=6198 RepID=A0A074Z005_OPIVI|nr:hypothetical protein T265_11166 [Opisthorchis viverrini]KER20243.1 hypothetical protein T265_11166 [Opisthorchis viverrini]